MNSSDAINELAAALSKAQGEMSGAKKDSTNPFFKSKYANLESVVDAIRIPFAKHGLSYMQEMKSYEGDDSMVTRIMHSSGQYIDCGPQRIPVKDKENPQAVKSSVTYMRRSQLLAACGLEEADDDGHAAAQPKQTFYKAPVKQSLPNNVNMSPAPFVGSKDVVLSESLLTDDEPTGASLRSTAEQLMELAPSAKQFIIDPGEYIFRIGQFKDQRVDHIDKVELTKWFKFFEKKKSTLAGEMIRAFELVETFLHKEGMIG